MFSVLSYNIREGGEDRLPRIAGIIRMHHPDAVALLEANDRARAQRLARELEMQFAFGEANNGYHVAWLSRLPIRRSENHRLAGLAKTLLEIEVQWAGIPLHLFATHLASRHDAHQPADEIVAILGVLSPIADRPHLLVGDFNALHPSDSVGIPPHGETKRGESVAGVPRRAIGRLLDAGYVDCFRARHPQAVGFTYPSDAPWLRLDYVFASSEMAAHLVGCDPIAGNEALKASDHLPIWAAFR